MANLRVLNDSSVLGYVGRNVLFNPPDIPEAIRQSLMKSDYLKNGFDDVSRAAIAVDQAKNNSSGSISLWLVGLLLLLLLVVFKD